MSDLIDRDAVVKFLIDAGLAGDGAGDPLVDAVRALPAVTVWVIWRSFDTAPRDGSRILAKGGGLDGVDICSYNARVGCWNCGEVTLDDTDHEPEGYNRPTQWASLDFSLPAIDPAPAKQVTFSEAEAIREAALREAASALTKEADKCEDAAKWGGHRQYVANCKTAAYALRDQAAAILALIDKGAG